MAMVVYGSVALTREQQNAHYIKSQVLLGTSASGSHRFLKSVRNATCRHDVAATRCLALLSAIALFLPIAHIHIPGDWRSS
jgi:hypothetical protein